MKKISLISALLLFATISYSQAIENPISTEEVVQTIIDGLKEQAHSREDNVIYDVSLLYSDNCYRQLISKATGRKVYIQVDCDAIHAKKGMSFIEEEAFERYEYFRKNERKFRKLDKKLKNL
jgi:Zn-finger protein